ncbi:MAG TPA: hypothetical protein VFX97_03900 [Pyrinomonadaceae bacterium]|nr:hypothetical protein [Pyrinomonadaceae bacterium]
MNLRISTDQQKYSRRQGLTLHASLVNNGDATVYIDRRMFWTGYAGGLKLEIANEKGQSLPAPMLSDAMMPPPSKDDTSILIALDEGFFYGTSVNLKVSEFFPTPGRYSLRVIYKSWLQRDLVAPQFRSLPALWADAPEISSNRLWIQVTR